MQFSFKLFSVICFLLVFPGLLSAQEGDEISDAPEENPKISLADPLLDYGLLIYDQSLIFNPSFLKKINLELKEYQESSGNYIWILVSDAFVREEVQAEIFARLQARYPQAKNHSFLFLAKNECNYCKQPSVSLDTWFYLDWSEPAPRIPSQSALLDKLNREIFDFYWRFENRPDRFQKGIKRAISLLQDIQDGKAGLEDIQPGYWEDPKNREWIFYTVLTVVFFLVVFLAVIFGIKPKTSGGAIGTSYSPMQNSLGESDPSHAGPGGEGGDDSSSGGSSGEDSSFGGGGFGGGGASGDY